MYYCGVCKKTAEGPNCPTCGKVFEKKDEIINCPNCGKMFFKPSRNFRCTRCNTEVIVETQQQTNQQTGFQSGVGGIVPPNFNQNQQSSIQSNMQNPNFNNQGQQNIQQNMQNGFNGNLNQQSSQNFNNQNQFNNGFNANQNVNSYNQNNFNQNQANLNNSNLQMNSNTNFNQNQNNNDFNSNNNQYQNIQNDSNLNQNQPNIQNNNQNHSSASDDLLSLYGQNNLSQNAEDSVNFNDLRSQDNSLKNESELKVSEDGKTYDENGFEVVDMNENSKSKKKNKKNKKSKNSEDGDIFANPNGSAVEDIKPRSKKGMTIFAFIELFLLLASIGFIGYLTLGKYFSDPCQRAWNEYQQSTVEQLIILGGEKGEIPQILKTDAKSEDGTYAVYKLKDLDKFILFKIEKGFAIGSFFDMSKVTIIPNADPESPFFYKTEEDAKNKMNSLIQTEKTKANSVNLIIC